jgi:7,8-dihydropterin-6-yl-methyl-4-(beta-D-ribofuranosyl)aminobenzene 5'-phosphate synthase
MNFCRNGVRDSLSEGVRSRWPRTTPVSGVRKVHAVMGGFHLAPFKDDYVEEVVASLKEIDPDYIIPMHCTGEPFWDIAKQELPGKLLRSYTGTRFVFQGA